jgi:hypothetical protein
MKKILLFIFSLIIFSFLIFILKNYFFETEKISNLDFIEENYIDFANISNEHILNSSLNKIEEKTEYKTTYTYIPKDFEEQVPDYINSFNEIIKSNYIEKKIENIDLKFYKNTEGIRWKMKKKSILFFWVDEMELAEFNAVWIHELAHYIDLYFLKARIFIDISDQFYKISWKEVTVIKEWQKQTDFVSWYAMTNRYEDFAESYTYFLLHNKDFEKKTQESDILKDKYDFFIKYLSKQKKFKNTDFSEDNEVKDYYRDTTKIEFSLKKFLEFLKK